MNTMITNTEKKHPSPDFGFPSHMVPMFKKDKKWCMEYIKAFHKEYTTGTGKGLRWASEDYALWRLYANGKQPIDQYKELMGVRKRKGRRDPSWLNINWKILSVMPRIKAVVKNKILSQPYEIMIKAIDQVSATEERMRRSEIVEFMAHKPFLDEATANLSIEAKSPFEPGEPVPENTREIDLYLQMFPKNRMALEMVDQIDLAMYASDWKQMREDIMENGFDVGIAGTRTYLDNRGVIRLRSVTPERLITNACIKKDYSDLIRIGEYIEMTISELRQRVPRGTFSEKDYAQMACTSSGKSYTYDVSSEKFFTTNNRYPWDHERITVLDAEWFSADDVANVVETDPTGKIKIIKKDDPYWLQKQGYTDKQYMDYHKERGSERQLVRDSVNNVYKGCWVVDTDFIFDYGLQSNMIRAISSMNDCELGYTLYSLQGAIPETAMPVLDDIQKNWLQYQHLTNQAKPPGIAVERRAVTQVTIGSGKTAITLSPEDILKQYAETGSYIYVGTDPQGKPYPFDPIKELKGGTPEQAFKCYENILRNIDLLRSVIGLNEFTDASSPDARANKDIVTEAVQNSNNALGTLAFMYTSIYERTAKKICLLVPDAENMGYNPGKIEALGEQSHQYLKANRDRNFIDFSLRVDLGITQEIRSALRTYVQQSMKSAANPAGILPEDAYLIENETNIHRAYMLLAQKRRQREEADFQRQQALMKQQADGNTQTALALEQAKQKTIFMQVQAAVQQAQMTGQITLQVEREKLSLEMILAKMQQGLDLKEHEAELYAKLMETQMKNAGNERVALINQQTQIQVAKMKPAPKPTSSKK